MNSSRTPEGSEFSCECCGAVFKTPESIQADACCPRCNSLVWTIPLVADGSGKKALPITREEIERALKGLPEMAAEIVSLRISGYSATQIAKRTGRSRRTIHFTLKLVEDRLQTTLGSDTKNPEED